MYQQPRTGDDGRILEAEGSTGIDARKENISTKANPESMTNELLSQDGKSRVKPAASSGTEGVEKEKASEAGPVFIVGFPGTGLVGSICANYIIEKKNMHQIAFVDSEYIIPSAIYIGGRLRHPFRIYADDEKTLYVLVCEAPLRQDGVHSIMGLIVSWASRNNVREMLVLDGIPAKGLPGKNRKPVILSSSPPVSSYPPKTDQDSVKGAMMIGLSGGLISACISGGTACTGVLIHSTSGIPDPEGAAIVLDSISKMPPVPLEIDVEPLRKQGQAIKHQLKGFIDSVRKEQKAEDKGGFPRTSRIYG